MADLDDLGFQPETPAVDDREQRSVDFQAARTQSDQALQDAISRQASAMQAGLDPNLASVKTWRFNQRANNALTMKQQGDDEQQRILDSEKLLSPDETPDGATFTHPWTSQKMEMSPGVRYTLGLRTRQAQQNADTLSAQSLQRLKDLGVNVPAAARSTQPDGSTGNTGDAAAAGVSNGAELGRTFDSVIKAVNPAPQLSELFADRGGAAHSGPAALHILTGVYDDAANDPQNSGKPVAKWKTRALTAQEQAVVDKATSKNQAQQPPASASLDDLGFQPAAPKTPLDDLGFQPATNAGPSMEAAQPETFKASHRAAISQFFHNLAETAQKPAAGFAEPGAGDKVVRPYTDVAERAVGEAAAPFQGAPGIPWLTRLVQGAIHEGGTLAGGALDFATSPLGLATVPLAGAPGLVGGATRSAMTGAMVPAASEAVQKAVREPTPENIGGAVAGVGAAALPLVHEIATVARGAEAPAGRSPAVRAVESARAGAEAIGGTGVLDDLGFKTEPATAPRTGAASGPLQDLGFRAASAGDQDTDLEQPTRRVTGSSNVPLNDTGRAESQELAQRTAGQFDRINSSPMDRAQETAQIVGAANPQAPVVVTDGLGPWKLGDHEAQPADQERAAIDRRITDTPDEAPPGRGPRSTDDGESFNAAKDRIIGEVQRQVLDAQPGESVLNVTHGRQLRMINAWAKAGFPEDRSIDLGEMTKNGDWAEPGQILRLTANGLDPVEDGTQGGLNFVRHGETDFSAETPDSKASGDATARVPLSAELRTVPERPETIQAQMGQLAAGVRRVVMLPAGTEYASALPERMRSLDVPNSGRFVYDPDEISPDAIRRAVRENRLTEILGAKDGGMGAPDKSQLKGPVSAVVAKDANGVPVQATATDEANLQATIAQTRKLMPRGGSVQVTAPEAEIADRMAGARQRNSKPLGEMSHDELSAAEDDAKNRDRNDLADLFGSEGAQRYNRLERAANSTARTHQESSQAQDELEKMEASLTEPQRNRLYGIGEADRPQLYEIREYRQALGRLDWDSPQALGDSLKWAVTGIGDKDNPVDMTAGERVRYAQLRYAMSEAARLGWDPVTISEAAMRSAAERFHPSEAPFMLRRFARPGVQVPIDRPMVEAPTPRDSLEVRRPSVPPAYGRGVSIAVPGEKTSYPARYAVRELSDVQPSHNAMSFEPNSLYEHTNDRDYSRAGNAARVVQNAAEGTFNPDFLTTDAPTAEHGTPVIDQNGNALGGNSRTMSLSRVYARGGADVDAYLRQVSEKAGQLGIDPAELARFKRPVLVREVSGDVDPQKPITDFNKTAAAELTPEERAVSDGRRLSDRTIREISGRLDELGEDGTLASALRGDDGAAVLNSLVKDGVLTDQEKGGYLDERGNLTPEAKARIGKALVGRLFDSPAEFRETTPEVRAKLERIAPQILRVEGRADWDLTDKLREGVALAEDARVHRMQPDEVARQGVIGGDRRYSPEAVDLAKTLEQSPVKAASAFRRYANDEALSREGAQSSMFAPPSHDEAFREAFSATAGRMATQRGAIDPNLLTLGGAKFIEKDVVPAAKKVAGDLVEAKDDIMRVVAPQLRTSGGAYVGLSLRNRMAQFARRFDQGEMRLRDAERFFNRRDPEQNYKFIDDIEHGRQTGDSNLDAIARIFRGMLDQRRREVQALGEGALEKFYTNYFPHIFDRPEQAGKFFDSFFSAKRNLEGPKSFLKHREFPTFKEALDAGMKPVSDNPVRLVMTKVREMDRYLMAHAVLRDLEENGFAKRVSTLAEQRAAGPAGAGDLFPETPGRPAIAKEDLPANFVRIVDPVGGGRWYAEDGAAQVLNNYLTPGLRSRSGGMRILLGLNNVMNQANLGLSAFHARAMTISSMAGRAGLGFEQAMRGEPIRGLGRVLTSPAAPVIDLMRGSKMMREWFKPGSQGAPFAAITDALMKGGGRARMDEFYANHAAEKMIAAFREGNFIGGLARSPFAAIETMAKPLMSYLVPRMKLGMFHDMAADELQRLGPGVTVDQTRAAMAKVWDHVENRLGEMTYDNLFWNRTFKDIAHLMVRSVGWNLGDLKEVNSAVGAVKQFASFKKPQDLHGLGFVMGYTFVGAMMGAMMQALHTGKGPQELKDYFWPKREDGRRYVSAPYVKDAYQFSRDLPGTMVHKTGPLVNTLAEMVTNKDYYDRPIRNLDDPLVKQLGQEAGFVGRQMLPFTLQQYFGPQTKGLRMQAGDAKAHPEHAVENFLGVQPAPAALQPNYKPRKASGGGR